MTNRGFNQIIRNILDKEETTPEKTNYNIENIQEEIILDKLGEGANLEQAAKIAGTPTEAVIKQIIEENPGIQTETIQQLMETKANSAKYVTKELKASAKEKADVHGEIINKYLKEWKNCEEITQEIRENPQYSAATRGITEKTVQKVLEQAGIQNNETVEELLETEEPSIEDIDGTYLPKKEFANISLEDHVVAYLGETSDVDSIAEEINNLYEENLLTGKDIADYLTTVGFAEYAQPNEFALDRSKLRFESEPENLKQIITTYAEKVYTE